MEFWRGTPYYAASGPGQGPVHARLVSILRLARTGLEPDCPGSQDRRPQRGGQRRELMSTAALAAISPPATEPIDLRLAQLRRMVLDSVVAENSKRNYAKALDDLFLFAASRPLTRALLMEWRAAMDKLSPSTVNVRLSAMRKLVTEARRNGMLGAEGSCEAAISSHPYDFHGIYFGCSAACICYRGRCGRPEYNRFYCSRGNDSSLYACHIDCSGTVRYNYPLLLRKKETRLPSRAS